MTSRIEVTIKFIIACWICIAIALSCMVKVFYYSDFDKSNISVINDEIISFKSSDVIISGLTYDIESNVGLIDNSNLKQLYNTDDTNAFSYAISNTTTN